MITTGLIPAQTRRLETLEEDTLDLVVVRVLHRAVLADLVTLSGIVGRLARRRAEDGLGGTRRRALALESYVGATCDSLDHHLAVDRELLRPALAAAVDALSGEPVPLSPTELVLPEAVASLRRVAHVLLSRPEDVDAAAQLAADLRRVEALVRAHVQHLQDVVLPAARTLVRDLGPVVRARRSDPAVALFDWSRMLHHADELEREHLRAVAPLRALVGPGAIADHRRRVRLLAA